jgi:hypothetical protein
MAKGLGKEVESSIKKEIEQVKSVQEINKLIEDKKFKEAYEKAREHDKRYGTNIAPQIQPYTVEYHPQGPMAEFARGVRDAIPFSEYILHVGKQEYLTLGNVAKFLGAKNVPEFMNVVGIPIPTESDRYSPFYWGGRVAGEVATGFAIGKAVGFVARPVIKGVKELTKDAFKVEPAKYELTTKGLVRDR